MRGIEMRMADHYCFQSSFTLDEINSLLVNVRDQVPEHVARGGSEEDGALADAELFVFGPCWRGVERVEVGGFGRGGDEPDVGVVGGLREGVCLVAL
jgi:hypothetical protein